jgi:hypothetical protein
MAKLRDERVLPARVADVGMARETSRQGRLSNLVSVGDTSSNAERTRRSTPNKHPDHDERPHQHVAYGSHLTDSWPEDGGRINPCFPVLHRHRNAGLKFLSVRPIEQGGYTLCQGATIPCDHARMSPTAN